MRIYRKAIGSPEFENVIGALEHEGPFELAQVRAHFSAPRIADARVPMSALDKQGIMVSAGCTLLDKLTMLADNKQPTYAISIDKIDRSWAQLEEGDENFAVFEIWSCIPERLTARQHVMGVALSFSEWELRDPRLSQAVEKMLLDAGFNIQALE